MKNAITITSTAIALIAVTITTPSTPPRTAITVDDELFSPSPSPSDDSYSHLQSDVSIKEKAIDALEIPFVH